MSAGTKIKVTTARGKKRVIVVPASDWYALIADGKEIRRKAMASPSTFVSDATLMAFAHGGRYEVVAIDDPKTGAPARQFAMSVEVYRS